MLAPERKMEELGHNGRGAQSFALSEEKGEPPAVLVAETLAGASPTQIPPSFSYFILATAGRGRCVMEGRSHALGPDTFLHLPEAQGGQLEGRANDPLRLCLVRYQPRVLSPELQTKLFALGALSFELGDANINQARAIRSIFQEMLFEQNASQECWGLILQARLVDLSVRTLRLAHRRFAHGVPILDSNSESSERVARYALRLKAEFYQQQSLSEAARGVGLSPRQFTRLFRQVTGQNWCKYVLDLRLKHAAGLLVSTERTVLEVAFESGFEDLSHFHRCFKVAFGTSPLAYRDQRQVRLGSRPSRAPDFCPGFKIRGVKGWSWTAEQYVQEIPIVADLKMNFVMDCDGAMSASGPLTTLREEWWEPMSDGRKQAYRLIIDTCRDHGLTFCFAPHPHLGSRSPMGLGKASLREALIEHYRWIQSQGVRWFGLCFDATSWGSAGPAPSGADHADLVNSIYRVLLGADEEARFLFRPVSCSGDGSNPEQRAYLEVLARQMHPDVFVLWDGDGVVTPRITRVAAESFKSVVKHRLFLWDNYPANDGSPTMHLGPLSGRDADLYEEIEGYITNPMHPQSQINRLPLATCAEYAFNPPGYNPARAIGQAICRFAKTASQQQVLKSLVETYPGFIVAGGGTGTNPVRKKFQDLMASQGSAAATRLRRELESLAAQLGRQFPKQFGDAKQSLEQDIAWMNQNTG